MAEHTKEKLTLNHPDSTVILTEDHWWIAETNEPEDARRLVASWNALLGIPIEDIEAGLIVMKVTDIEAALENNTNG